MDDDITVSDTSPWSQPKPHICLSLTTFKKDCIGPEVFKQLFFLLLHHNTKTVKIFTDGSKVDEKVTSAPVSSVAPFNPFSCRLRHHGTIYTAELQASLFALKKAYQSQESKFIILSESLSALQHWKN